MKTKQKKSWASKLIALCMAMVLALAMNVTVFAAINLSTDRGTITVNGMESDEGATITAYKVIKINFNDDSDVQQPEEPVYTWTDEMATWLNEGGAGHDDFGTYIGEENVVTDVYQDLSAAAMNTFYKEVADAAETIFGTGAAGTGTITSGTTTINSVEIGHYLLVAEPAAGKTATYQPMIAKVDITYDSTTGWTISSPTVSMKGSTPEIGKDADTNEEAGSEAENGSVAIGDIVDYTLTADIPNYPSDAQVKSFKIGDSLSAGLDFNSDVKVLIGTTFENAIVLTKDIDYSLTLDEDGFVVDMKNFYDKITSEHPTATKIFVTYSATVNENAFEEDALGNDAFLGYTNNPYNDSDSKSTTTEDVYTYGIELTKLAKDDNTFRSGAEFELRESADGNAMTFVSISDGVYRLAKAGEQGTTTLVVSLQDGTLSIQGIDLGTYYLRETKAPEGYVLPKNDIEITLVDTGNGIDGKLENSTSVSYSGDDTEASIGDMKVTDNIVSFDIYNVLYTDNGFQLPTTGGMGTAIFTIAGILLMGGAVVLVVVAARKRNHQA